MQQEMIWKYFIQVCKGLQHLHQNNIIHRDIKPANIFVGEHDVVKVNARRAARKYECIQKFLGSVFCYIL